MSRFKKRHKSQQKKKKITQKLSEHFSKDDFKCKVHPDCHLKISLGLIGGLELLRSQTSNDILILKGYESKKAAEASGKLKRNYHTMGLAADIQIKGTSLNDLFQLIDTISDFKGIGINIDEQYIHVDVRKEDEKEIWIEKGDDIIEFTEENKQKYLDTTQTPH